MHGMSTLGGKTDGAEIIACVLGLALGKERVYFLLYGCGGGMKETVDNQGVTRKGKKTKKKFNKIYLPLRARNFL